MVKLKRLNSSVPFMTTRPPMLKRSPLAKVWTAAIHYLCDDNEQLLPSLAGDMIRILDRSEDGWWTGEKDGVRGHFPSMLVAELGEGEDEDEDEEEEEERGAFDDGSEEGESGGGSAGSPAATTPTSAPPPTFAPPKPINLVPQQIVIMQPTPEIESKGTFGEGLEQTGDDVVSTDDGIGEESPENEVSGSVTPEKKSQPSSEPNGKESTEAEQVNTH